MFHPKQIIEMNDTFDGEQDLLKNYLFSRYRNLLTPPLRKVSRVRHIFSRAGL